MSEFFKQIQDRLQVDESTAIRIEDIIAHGNVGGTPGLDKWASGFAQPPEESLVVLTALNIILDGCGVCPIMIADDETEGEEEQIGWFINRGFSLLPTVLYVFGDDEEPDTYEIMSLNDFLQP